MTESQPIGLKEGYGKSGKSENGKSGKNWPKLKKIPMYPPEFKDWKIAIRGIIDEHHIDSIRAKLNKEKPGFTEKVTEYMKRLRQIREYNYEWAVYADKFDFEGEGIPPVERVIYHDRPQWRLLYDFDFDEEGNEIRMYIPIKTVDLHLEAF